MLFKVQNIHFFHVVAVVFDCGYYFVDVGVVVADYFGQTRSRDDRTFSRQPLFLRRRSRATRTYRQRAKILFFILSLLSFFCPYCKLNFPACQQNMNKISHFVYLCHSDCLFDSIYISFFYHIKIITSSALFFILQNCNFYCIMVISIRRSYYENFKRYKIRRRER